MPVRFETSGRIATITLDRPEARNAIDGAMATELEAAIERLESDPGLWVGILRAEGPVFSAGADLKVVADGRSAEFHTAKGGFAGIVELERRKPLIAAVAGPALAGGFEIVLSCDLIVASSDAVFGLPEASLSILAAAGGLFRSARRLPRSVAMEMALTGDSISAKRANDLGFVNRLAEPGQTESEANSLATRIAGNAPLAVEASRRVILECEGLDEAAAFRVSKAAMDDIAKTEDFGEGPRAFVEKRPPVWQRL